MPMAFLLARVVRKNFFALVQPLLADDMQELVGTAMDNLALATVTKQTTLDMLAQSNTTLVKVNSEQQNTITKLTNKITALEKKLDQSSGGGGGGGASERFDPNMYCWSHGYKNYPITTVPPAETRRRDIRARPPVRTIWEVAFGMQDLAMPPTERDEANHQRIFVVKTLT